MGYYAQIDKNNVVYNITTFDLNGVADAVKIDKFDLDLLGATYDKATGSFAKEVHSAIRKISKGAFRRRLYTSEKVAIKTSTDPVVKVLEDDLLVTSFVDLDFQSLIDGIDYLIAINILTPARKAELLKDGEQHEI